MFWTTDGNQEMLKCHAVISHMLNVYPMDMLNNFCFHV